MRLEDKMIELIEENVRNKNITKRKHPEFDLYILNYTASAVYNKEWNPATLLCRGLIIDSEYNIVSRPFPKFFNYEEYGGEIKFPDKFKFYEKIDGSLGILYYAGGHARISTRGSFTSDQAKVATEILHTKYKDWIENAWSEERSSQVTLLFEIVYPQNKIIVDYGDTRELYLIGCVLVSSGRSVIIPGLPFPEPQGFVCDNPQELIEYVNKTNTHEKEGFVVHFPIEDIRIKMKYDKYMKVAKTLNKLSKKVIWEHLKEFGNVDKIIELVPDEFHQEIRKVEKDIREKYNKIEEEAKDVYKNTDTNRDRGQIARDFIKYKYHNILFNMLDQKSYEDILWKIVKPNAKEDDYFFELPQ